MSAETEQDDTRVRAIPSYKRWSEKREDWQYDYQQQQYAKANAMRAKAKAAFDAEMQKIAEWENVNASFAASYEAWSKADKKRYWKLRRV